MKTSSWEIILAGIIFTGIAIYLIDQNSNNNTRPSSAPAADSLQINIDGDPFRVLEFKSLKSLESLENLERLENLESLKSLANFLPAEVRTEFETEIDAVIKEFEQESVHVNINPEKGTITFDKTNALTPGTWSAVSPGIYAYVNRFDAANLEKTNLSLPFGSINVVGSDNNQAKLTIQASGDISSKSELQSHVELITDIKNDRASFIIKPRDSSSGEPNIHFQATLEVPGNSILTAKTNAGHISSENISGAQVYQTNGGHISLKRLEGNIEAQTSGGHITISNSKGELLLKSGGGNLQATDVIGSIQASTNGGNVEIHFSKIINTSNISTGAGTITLGVPKETNTTFNLSGSSVEIGPELSFQGVNTTETAKGTIGKDSSLVTAKTNYGKVILKALN